MQIDGTGNFEKVIHSRYMLLYLRLKRTLIISSQELPLTQNNVQKKDGIKMSYSIKILIVGKKHISLSRQNFGRDSRGMGLP